MRRPVFVVATAGHVDHGKSALVRALTGMEPDRYAEEQRRGMTIDLGFVWCTLPSGRTVAFVDVPGHERFVPTMLAGVGPVPAVLLVVAADGGWMPQTAEHAQALDALGVRHGVVAVTRSDLADPAPALAATREHLAGTHLADLPAVPVSSVSGEGLDRLGAALDHMLSALPAPDPAAPVRLWLDRAFTIRGSGTVVTGTLGAGTVRVADELTLLPVEGPPRDVVVREVQRLGQRVDAVAAVARAALNLRGLDRDAAARGAALLTPGGWTPSQVVDVCLPGDVEVPSQAVAHVGSAAVPVRIRPLGPATVTSGPPALRFARLQFARPLPLTARDLVLLRDPGRRRIIGGATVLDVAPPALRRRGAAVARARDLADVAAGPPRASDVLARRGIVRRAELTALGVTAVPADAVVAGAWALDRPTAQRLRDAVRAAVATFGTEAGLDAGPRVEDLCRRLGLPDEPVLRALLTPPLTVREGRVVDPASAAALPGPVAAGLARIRAALTANPFEAPDGETLRALGLGPRELAAAERSGAVLRLADAVVVAPDALERAVEVLRGLPQPFTVSQARAALGTSRRVALPLLTHLDRAGLTGRDADDRRRTTDLAGPLGRQPAATPPGSSGGNRTRHPL